MFEVYRKVISTKDCVRRSEVPAKLKVAWLFHELRFVGRRNPNPNGEKETPSKRHTAVATSSRCRAPDISFTKEDSLFDTTTSRNHPRGLDEMAENLGHEAEDLLQVCLKSRLSAFSTKLTSRMIMTVCALRRVLGGRHSSCLDAASGAASSRAGGCCCSASRFCQRQHGGGCLEGRA